MNYKLISSVVLTGMLLLQGALAFGDSSLQCAPTDKGQENNVISSNLMVNIENDTLRIVVVTINTGASASPSEADSGGASNGGHSSSQFANNSDNGGGQAYTHINYGPNYYYLQNPGQLTRVVVLQPGASVNVYNGSAYCSGNPGGQFAFSVTMDGVTLYAEMGGSSAGDGDYAAPHTTPVYYNRYPTVIEANAPVFSATSPNVPLDFYGAYQSQHGGANPSSNPGNLTPNQTMVDSSTSPWFITANDPGNTWHLGYLRFIFVLPQIDADQSYAAMCPSGYYGMGPLCYQYVFGNNQEGDGYGDDVWYLASYYAPTQADTLNIRIQEPRAINVYRTQLNPFLPHSYDHPAGCGVLGCQSH